MWNLAIMYRPRSIASVMAVAGVTGWVWSMFGRGEIGDVAAGVGVVVGGMGVGVDVVVVGGSGNWRAAGRLRRHCSS